MADKTARGDEATDLPLLGRYRVEGMLGEGGLGMVVKAFDTRLKRMVAIKTLKRTTYTVDPDQFRALEERFAREAEAASRMGSHPNLVSVHDLVIDPDRTQYLILEYVPGGTLSERIARDPVPLAEALRLTSDIAEGLQAAHDMGLVHRDIKPANIFLTATGRAKIGDFGIAQIDDISGRTRTTSGHPGTPLYMSPEQERQTAYLRPASDQYSLGLILFELLTGQVYKRVGSRQAAQLLAAQPTPVAALVERLLAEDADDRYPAMEGVVRAVQAISRQIASADTIPPLPPGSGSFAPLHDIGERTVTRQATPRVGLQPVPSLALPASPYAIPTSARYSRRAVLVGAGGLVIAAGAAGAAFTGLRQQNGSIATATVAATVIAAAPTTSATATSAPRPTVIGISTTAPIVITAPPIVITATPAPIPTAPPILPTAPPATATPQPATAIPFPTVAPAQSGSFVTWTDTQNRIRLAYPGTWSLVRLADQNEIFEVDSGDAAHFDAYTTQSLPNETPMNAVLKYRDRQSQRTDRSYNFGAPFTGTLGGQSAAFLPFTSTSRTNQADTRVVQAAYAMSGGWTFLFESFTDGPAWRHQDQLQAILQSIAFP